VTGRGRCFGNCSSGVSAAGRPGTVHVKPVAEEGQLLK
jgi:hypothetical protein